MTTRIEIQQNVRDVFGNRHWVTATLMAEDEIPLLLLQERIKSLREFLPNPNDIRAVRITEEVIA